MEVEAFPADQNAAALLGKTSSQMGKLGTKNSGGSSDAQIRLLVGWEQVWVRRLFVSTGFRGGEEREVGACRRLFLLCCCYFGVGRSLPPLFPFVHAGVLNKRRDPSSPRCSQVGADLRLPPSPPSGANTWDLQEGIRGPPLLNSSPMREEGWCVQWWWLAEGGRKMEFCKVCLNWAED